tara:strand:- start:1405 stop:1707 length:303 start_codon:yes stop_codon:yes gene_type:complete
VFLTLLWVTTLRGQQQVEIIPYQIIPGYGIDCPLEIQLIKPITTQGIVRAYEEELVEIFIDRIIFENTNQWAVNETFIVDGKHYHLLRLPYTGYNGWYIP